ncbi:MAG: hypothetical protein HYU67_00550 [Flavobacteriia bacterium]|nr:hypothetical protein [Flavobacteriia bacterium]
MKKTLNLFWFLAILLLNQAFSQSLIAVESNGATSYTQNFEQAIGMASSGSIIYLPGGTFSQGSAIIDKKLTILGVGHHPDSTLATNQTIIAGDIALLEGASETHLEGLYITNNISVAYQNKVDNLVIRRCSVNDITANGSHWSQADHDSTYSYNWQIIHNVIRNNVNFGNLTAFTFKGNIIKGNMAYAFLGGTFENNVFLYNSASNHLIDELRFCTFKNNIFLHTWELSYPGYACSGGVPCGSYNNTFLNNSFCMGGQNLYLENGTASVALNNKYDALITESLVNATENVFNYSGNYHIHPNLNSSLVGTDGLELGIYGGNDVYKEGAVPHNPHIYFKNIAPSTTPDGMLNVNIKVNAQNN